MKLNSTRALQASTPGMVFIFIFLYSKFFEGGARSSIVVKALCYKLECRGF
jgi:hypothetical protein